MSDIRAVPVILDEKRKAALVDRLKSMSAFTGEELEAILAYRTVLAASKT